jgi:diguanylate cyclase (GGDEF)-like protein
MKPVRSEQEYQNILRRLELALDASRIGVWEHDLSTDVLTWDEQMFRLYGRTKPGGVVDSSLWSNAIHPEDLAGAKADFADAVRRRNDYSSEYRILLPDGAVRHLRSRARYFEENGKGTFIGAEWDVTADVELNRELSEQTRIAERRAEALEETAARIEHAAAHDYLTGLPNRRFFDRKLTELSGSGDTAKLALFHIGLDRFAMVNDLVGHDAGDRLLKATAAVLADQLPEGTFLARIGGDEFAALIGNFPSVDSLRKLADQLLESLKRPIWHSEGMISVTASIGIASAHTGRVSNLLAESDIALMRAKRGGRNRADFFSAQMKAQINSERRLADQFARGLERGEFVPFYQAQVDARTRRIVGVEALARWRHPKRGLLAPGEFLGTAAGLGMLEKLDATILRQTLLDRKTWTRNGVRAPKVAVNVSAARLSDVSLIPELKALDIEPGSLSFELLETIFLDEIEDGMLTNVSALKSMFIDIEVDDFGSGHASIIGLMKLKPRRLKIDRRLVKPITTSREQKRLLRSIVEIAKALGIEVVAEGVETQEHARLLTRLGCDVLQGYAIAYPVSAEDMLDALIEADEGKFLTEA